MNGRTTLPCVSTAAEPWSAISVDNLVGEDDVADDDKKRCHAGDFFRCLSPFPHHLVVKCLLLLQN